MTLVDAGQRAAFLTLRKPGATRVTVQQDWHHDRVVFGTRDDPHQILVLVGRQANLFIELPKQ